MPKNWYPIITPSVDAKPVSSKPSKVEPTGNCAYPKTPFKSPPKLTTHKLRYLVGSQIVFGFKLSSISASCQNSLS